MLNYAAGDVPPNETKWKRCGSLDCGHFQHSKTYIPVGLERSGRQLLATVLMLKLGKAEREEERRPEKRGAGLSLISMD